MIEKRLSEGSTSYYWNPPVRDQRNGFPLHGEALGPGYGPARERAEFLNKHLYEFRAGRNAKKDLNLNRRFETMDWVGEIYLRSDRCKDNVSERSLPEYRRAINLVLDHLTRSGKRVGELSIHAMSARGADALYKELKVGPKGPRLRQANVCMTRMATAWSEAQRLYPKVMPAQNFFAGVRLRHGKAKARAASREECYALHRALVAAGEPYLAVVPLAAFEWHQRPENVIAGYLKWSDWRPGGEPFVRVVHGKNDVVVEMPLGDDRGPFFPELTAYMDRLQPIGLEVVLRRPQVRRRGETALPGVKFAFRDARKRVRRAAIAAGLPSELTLAACRHGGLTELGNAGVTEQEGMAASGHNSPEAHRGYVSHTNVQRHAALRKRRSLRLGRTTYAQESE